MKILFLNPPTKDKKKYIREGRCMQLTSSWASIWPPLTLAILARIAIDLGFKAEIFDSNVQHLEFSEVASLAVNVDILVINTSFPSINSDLEVARVIKSCHKDVVVISFGVFFTLLEKESFPTDGSIDYAIVGEPEETFRELLVSIKQNSNKQTINGLIYLTNNSHVQFTGARQFVTDIDTIPIPDRSLLKNERYLLPQNGEPFTLVNTSRGCPFPCTYCIVQAYYGGNVRRHSLKYIFEEIVECVNRFNIKNFLLWEEAFTLDKKVVHEFCNGIIERQLDISWAVTTRADSLDTESLQLMKQTGCFLVGLGIESSSQVILDMAKKQEKIEEIVEGVNLCKEVGIPTMGHFIFGLPGETKDTARETINFMKTLDITYMQSYCAVPYPKTEFGEQARAKGWVSTRDWSEYDFGGSSIVNMPAISSKDVTKFRGKAFRAFYLKPGKIIEEIKKFKSLRNLLPALNFWRWIK